MKKTKWIEIRAQTPQEQFEEYTRIKIAIWLYDIGTIGIISLGIRMLFFNIDKISKKIFDGIFKKEYD